MRSYIIVGTGALGSLYGARLAAAGHDVRFLARSDATVLRTDGLCVTLPDRTVHIGRPEVFTEASAVPESDVIVVALKAAADPNPAVAPLETLRGATIVTLQNGLGIEDDLAAAAGGRPLLGGLCFTAANRVGPGRVELLGGGSITLAEHHATAVTPTALAVAADFNAAGVPVTCEADLVAARWRKLAWNVPFNSLAALDGCTPDELLAEPDGEQMVRGIMAEVGAAAAANGKPYPLTFIDDLIAHTLTLPPYRTSMGLDAEAGRPLETDVIVGRPLRAGRARGVEMPLTASLLDRLGRLRAP